MDDSTVKRFLGKVDEQPNGCWRWRGTVNKGSGYAYFWFDGKSRLAHRWAYKAFVGDIPDGMELDHECHTRDESCPGTAGTCLHRRCVNPAHVRPLRHLANVLCGRGHAARNAAKSTCDKGHPFDETNTYIYPNGDRGCRECRRLAQAEWRNRERGYVAVPHAEKTHCPQNHPYDEVNTYLIPGGGRGCRACRRKADREAKRAARARKKAALTPSV